MLIDYVNKRINCPVCNKQTVVFIDLNDLKKDFEGQSGIVKRSLSHFDHLLILDIDFNGDVRTIIPVNFNENITSEDQSIPRFLSTDLQDTYLIKKKIVLLSDSDIFFTIFSNQLSESVIAGANFTANIQNNEFEMTHQNLTILWVKSKDIHLRDNWEFDTFIIDLIDMEAQKQLELLTFFTSLKSNFFKQKQVIINLNVTIPSSLEIVKLIKGYTKENNLLQFSLEYKEKVALLESAIS